MAQGKSLRGFASMDPEKRRSICSEGGKAAHRNGTARKWTREEAILAGKKGGQIAGRNRFKKDRSQVPPLSA